jgi:ABC-type dipeptide/oligopeptide/nickel transport system permease subunit/ABC-type transport system substrate-binding protein
MTAGGAALAWQRFRKDRAAMLGLALVAALVAFAVLGPLVGRWGPDESDFTLRRGAFGAPPGPSAAHWLGTDHLFRDLFARLAAGAQVSLAVGVLATALATLIGTAVGVAAGMTAGTRLGFVDAIAMRVVDVLLALPFLLFVTAIGVAVGRTDIGTVLLVLGCAGWTGTARLVRAKTLELRERDFVAAARALGAGTWRVVLRHVLPNLAGALVVVASTSVAQMILAEAVLGYLTVGIPPPRATWGRMLHEAEPFFGTRLSLLAIPGFAILLAVLGWNRVGDGLRRALAGGGRDARAAAATGGKLPVDLLLAAAAMLLLTVAKPNDVAGPLPAPAREIPKRGGTLRLATYVNLRSLDPAIAFDETSSNILQLAFARLVTWDAEGRIVPDLARSFTVSEDGRTLTFELRENVRFHDGTPVLAADVARSLERLLHPKTPSPAASMYATIKGYAAYHAGKAPHLEGVRVLGERLVAIELTEPDATILPKLTLHLTAPVCASMGPTADRSAQAVPCGAGPFRVASFDADKGVRLVRHEAYFVPGRPYLDAIELSVHVPSTSQRYKLERGDLDYVSELSGSDRDLFLASPRWAGRGRWTLLPRTDAIFMNTEVPPFDNRAVRRAVSFALDPSVVERMRVDLVEADRILPPVIPGPPRDEPMRRHDLAAALAEMERAGYAFDPRTKKGGWPAPIDFVAVADTSDQQHGEVWMQQLARIGIRLRLKLVTYATSLAETGRRRTAAMGRAGWGADFPDPSNFFEPTLSTEAIQDEGSENAAFFSNAEFDRVLAAAHGERDPQKRDALYLRAEEIVRDEAPWVPTHGARRFELWQPYVHGYEPQKVVQQRFAGVWIDKGGEPPVALFSPLGTRGAR